MVPAYARRATRLVPALLLGGAVACASLGPAPARLSAELGDRLAEMRGLHQLALERVFENERRRVEDFIDDEWTPLFLKNFLAESRLLAEIERLGMIGEEERALLRTVIAAFLADTSEAQGAANRVADAVSASRSGESAAIRTALRDFVEDDRLDAASLQVVSLLGARDPGLLILEWAEDAQAEIDAQRREMLEPLQEAQRQATAELTEAYAEVLKANGVITARLEAAAKASAQEDAMLGALGVGDAAERVRARLARISAGVGTALELAQDALARGDAGAAAASLRQALGQSN